MSNEKFTPGEYHVIKHSWSDTSIEADSGLILCTSTIDDEDNQEDMEEWQAAQMALFAAAPAMYKALAELEYRLKYQVENYQSSCEIDDSEAENILKILAAARGEPTE